MIPSLYQMDFVTDSGSLRLLDYGDILTADPAVTVTQEADRYAPIGAAWSEGAAKGGATTSITWGVVRKHASHAALRAYCVAHAAALPTGVTGTLRVVITGSGTWDIAGVDFLTSSTSPLVPSSDYSTLTVYTLIGSSLAPATPAEIPPIDAPPTLLYRVTEEVGPNGLEKWIEFGTIIPDSLAVTGSAATGWTDHLGQAFMILQRSETLMSWTTGEFIDCVGSPQDNGDGTHTYWARSIWPIDSEQKTGQLWCASDKYEDPRNGPFVALTINDTIQALPNFPYAMPGDAAQMQTDLVAAGWSGSTVSATESGVWRVDIPASPQDAYTVKNYLHWPIYYTEDRSPTSPTYGQIVIPHDGRYFAGSYVNNAGVRTTWTPQFARIAYRLLPQ